MFRSILSALVITLMSHAVQAQATAPNVVTTESTTTATVERVERSSRMLTLRSGGNVFQTVAVDPSVKAFDDLKQGDVVTVRYVESIVVQVRPGAALTDVKDSTAEAQKAGNNQVLQQLTAVVKVERIDPQGLSVEYRTRDNRKVLRSVADKRVLEGLKVGDQVEVTLTRERAIGIERVRR
jgi:hypothetical protein